jgi:hypothetical protein
MRFDVGRVVALAGALETPRVQTPRGERAAADALASAFEDAGLRVERVRCPVVFRSSWVPAIGYGLVLVLVLWGEPSALPRPHRAWLMVLFVTSLFLAAWWSERSRRKAGLTEPSEHVIGRPAGKSEAPTRVILLTSSLTEFSTVKASAFLLLSLLASVPLLAMLTPWYEHEGSRNPDVALGLLIGSWLGFLLLVLVPFLKPRRPFRGDDRTGLALLAELARTWPGGMAAKVETWFIASPNALALGAELRRESRDGRPTLVIKLRAPGVGPQLVIAGRGPARRLAEAAARDLWLPHQASRRTFGLLPSSLRGAGMHCVALCGRGDDSPINPALLAATAQLATELALRWAKQPECLSPSKTPTPDALD